MSHRQYRSLIDLKQWGLALAIIMAALPCAAQAPADSTRSAVLRTAVENNWHVRLSTARDSLDGRVVALEGGTVRLIGGRVALGEITRIERQRKEGGGAILGGLAGGLGLGAIGYMLAGLCESGCNGAREKGLIMGGLTGGVLGALLGNAVAPARRRWEAIWP